jgi:hypothetical protein
MTKKNENPSTEETIIPTKVDVIFKFLLISYLERKQELKEITTVLKSMMQPIDLTELKDDTTGYSETLLGFNSAITSSILEIQETLIKNDENFAKILETLRKYQVENDNYEETDDSVIEQTLVNVENVNYNSIIKTLSKY